jgi:hypothetical protein
LALTKQVADLQKCLLALLFSPQKSKESNRALGLKEPTEKTKMTFCRSRMSIYAFMR